MKLTLNGEALDRPADTLPIGIAAALQWKQAKGPQPMVQCASCDGPKPLRFLFRCLYCGLWFCQSCGEVHFGETRIARTARLGECHAQDCSQK